MPLRDAVSCRNSMIAHASDNPSNVAVPRPTSSRTMSDDDVALLRMFAVSCISTMNVDSPRARWSDAREDAIENAECRFRGGDKTAGLVEKNDERDLAQVGRFAAHVRAGDDLNPVAIAIDVGVVGNESLRRDLLDHRMAA